MQLALEQHRLEIWKSTYTWIFFSSKYYSPPGPVVSWICGGTVYLADGKWYEDFWLLEGLATLTTDLLKSQMCLILMKWETEVCLFLLKTFYFPNDSVVEKLPVM